MCRNNDFMSIAWKMNYHPAFSQDPKSLGCISACIFPPVVVWIHMIFDPLITIPRSEMPTYSASTTHRVLDFSGYFEGFAHCLSRLPHRLQGGRVADPSLSSKTSQEYPRPSSVCSIKAGYYIILLRHSLLQAAANATVPSNLLNECRLHGSIVETHQT